MMPIEDANSKDTDAYVAYSQVGAIAHIKLRRSEKRNAITPGMAERLERALESIEVSPDIRVGIVSSEGPVFCSGADLNYVAGGEGHRLSTKNGGFAGFVRYPRTKPLIAAIQGSALAGGFEIALACDIIVAEKSARFGLPEVTRGIIANGGGLLRLSSVLPSALALDLILTGRTIDAEEAARFGIVSRVVADGAAADVAETIAEQLATFSPEAVQASLRVARVAGYSISDTLWDLSSAVASRLRASNEAVRLSKEFVQQEEVKP